MKININISLTDASGRPFPTTGFLNVYRKADGSLISGKKAYPTESEANDKSRPAAGWTKVGVVKVEEYLAGLNDVTRKAAITACDARLSILLGLTPAITPIKISKPKAKAKSKPKSKAKPATKVKPKAKAKARR